jgi:hypothetical protein
MTNSKLIKTSIINSIAAWLYVSGVALLMTNAQKIFGKEDNVFTGVAVLMLFVISATIMGFLVLGKPLMMYLDGFKKEALKLFYFTVAWLILIAFLIFTGLAIFG